jgi:hypothetical protein
MPFKGAELHYPVHEKEMLAIIRALRKWHVNLIGSPFLIYTDHKTLENFDTQKELSLWYVSDRLIIPRITDVWETLFRLAHDSLGHFGFDKSYESLRRSYYWPHMRTDLEDGYVPGCPDCQCNKSHTKKLSGPLHPLPVPEARGDSVGIDFIGPLPVDEGKNCIVTLRVSYVIGTHFYNTDL